MGYKLTILGCNAATPTTNSHPTAQYLQFADRHFLIDCGEGTQVQLRKYKAKFNQIHHIFISHLHGDHFFGLIGLISTFQLLGRTADLHIYGPKGIQEIIEIQLKWTKSYKTFALFYHELESKKSELIFEDKQVEVYTIPLKHRVYCNGYLFKEKPKKRKLNIDAITAYPEIEVCDYAKLKNGKNYTLETGEVIDNEFLTFDPPKPLSYAFCSDTSFNTTVIPLIKKADLLYHEATFLENKKDLAQKTGHSTALEAAQIAEAANVKKLVLGHFSNRYSDVEEFKKEAKQCFQATELAHEGAQFIVK